MRRIKASAAIGTLDSRRYVCMHLILHNCNGTFFGYEEEEEDWRSGLAVELKSNIIVSCLLNHSTRPTRPFTVTLVLPSPASVYLSPHNVSVTL